MRASCFSLYLDRPQACQYKHISKEDPIKSISKGPLDFIVYFVLMSVVYTGKVVRGSPYALPESDRVLHVLLRESAQDVHYSPYASRNATGVVDSNEFVACGRNMEVGLLLIDEEGVRHPDVLDEFRSHGQGFDARPLSECKPWICPKLTEVEVQREVLWVKEEQIRGRGVSRVWKPPLWRGRPCQQLSSRKHCLV